MADCDSDLVGSFDNDSSVSDVPIRLDVPYAEAFELLDRVARGLAITVGPNCETLVQRLEGTGLVVESIYHGHVSGRSKGSTHSIYGGDTTADDASGHAPGEAHGNPFPFNCVNMLVTLPDGRHLKSSSWGVIGSDYVLYLGMNIDITSLELASSMLSGMVATGGELMEQLDEHEPSQEAGDVFDACLARLGKPVELLTRTERIGLVRELRDAGFFGYQRSVPLCAQRLGVSKASVYNYLHALD